LKNIFQTNSTLNKRKDKMKKSKDYSRFLKTFDAKYEKEVALKIKRSKSKKKEFYKNRVKMKEFSLNRLLQSPE